MNPFPNKYVVFVDACVVLNFSLADALGELGRWLNGCGHITDPVRRELEIVARKHESIPVALREEVCPALRADFSDHIHQFIGTLRKVGVEQHLLETNPMRSAIGSIHWDNDERPGANHGEKATCAYINVHRKKHLKYIFATDDKKAGELARLLNIRSVTSHEILHARVDNRSLLRAEIDSIKKLMSENEATFRKIRQMAHDAGLGLVPKSGHVNGRPRPASTTTVQTPASQPPIPLPGPQLFQTPAVHGAMPRI